MFAGQKPLRGRIRGHRKRLAGGRRAMQRLPSGRSSGRAPATSAPPLERAWLLNHGNEGKVRLRPTMFPPSAGCFERGSILPTC